MSTDVILNDSKGYYDFGWTPEGDFTTAQTLDTYILMCIFEEVRASAAEVPPDNLRRGWLGNESTPNFEQGSKSWLFSQSRARASDLVDLGPVIRNGLNVLITDGIAKDVVVETPFLQNGKVCVIVNLFRDGSPVDSRFYELWENTGTF